MDVDPIDWRVDDGMGGLDGPSFLDSRALLAAAQDAPGLLCETLMEVLRRAASALPAAATQPLDTVGGLSSALSVQLRYLSHEYVLAVTGGMPPAHLHDATLLGGASPLVGLSPATADTAGVRGALRVERALWRATAAVCAQLPDFARLRVAAQDGVCFGAAVPLGDGIAWEGVLADGASGSDPHSSLLSALLSVLCEGASDDAAALLSRADALAQAASEGREEERRHVARSLDPDHASALAAVVPPSRLRFESPEDIVSRSSAAAAAATALTDDARNTLAPAGSLWRLARCGRVAIAGCPPPSDGGLGALELASHAGAPWLAATLLATSPLNDRDEGDATGGAGVGVLRRRGNAQSSVAAAIARVSASIVAARGSSARAGMAGGAAVPLPEPSEDAAEAALLLSVVAGRGDEVILAAASHSAWGATSLVRTWDDAAWLCLTAVAAARAHARAHALQLAQAVAAGPRIRHKGPAVPLAPPPLGAFTALGVLDALATESQSRVDGVGGLAHDVHTSPYAQCMIALAALGEAVASEGGRVAGAAGIRCLLRVRDVVLGALSSKARDAVIASREGGSAASAAAAAAAGAMPARTPEGEDRLRRALFQLQDMSPHHPASPDAILVNASSLPLVDVPLLRWGAHMALALLLHSPLSLAMRDGGVSASSGNGTNSPLEDACDDLVISYARHLASSEPRVSHAEAVVELARHCVSRARAVRLLTSYALTLPYHHPPEGVGGGGGAQGATPIMGVNAPPRLQFLEGAATVTHATFGGAWGSDILGSALRHAVVGSIIPVPPTMPPSSQASSRVAAAPPPSAPVASAAPSSSGIYGLGSLLSRRGAAPTLAAMQPPREQLPLGGLPLPMPPPHLPAAARAAGLSLVDFTRVTALQWLGAGPQVQKPDATLSPYLHYCVGAANALSRTLAVQSSGRDVEAATSARAALLLLHTGLPLGMSSTSSSSSTSDPVLHAPFLSYEARAAQEDVACDDAGGAPSPVLCAVAGEARVWEAYARVLAARGVWSALVGRGLPTPPPVPQRPSAPVGSLAHSAEEVSVARCTNARRLHVRSVVGVFQGASSVGGPSTGGVAAATSALHAAIHMLVFELSRPVRGTGGVPFAPGSHSGALVFSPTGDSFVTPLSLPGALEAALPPPSSLRLLILSHAAAWLAESALSTGRWIAGDPIAAALYERPLRAYYALAEDAWHKLSRCVCDGSSVGGGGMRCCYDDEEDNADEARGDAAASAFDGILPQAVIDGLESVAQAASREMGELDRLLPQWVINLPDGR